MTSISHSASSARGVALSVLVESVTSEEGVDIFLERAFAKSSLDSRDRALAMELVYGVLRRLATLDWRLEPVLDKPLPRLPVVVQMLLRLGAYQLLYLDRIPPSAAVNESVRLAKACARTVGRDWSGLINAVLRGLLRHPPELWPDLQIEPARALSLRHSIPEWLSQRWVSRVGVDVADRVCEQASSIPPVTLRVNQLKGTREDLLYRLRQAGIAARPTSVSPQGVVLEGGGIVSSLPGFHEGAFYVEDEAAQLIPPLLDPQPGEAVLDACAAPGGKAVHLAELMHNRGTVIAMDRHHARLKLLQDNCRRMGVGIVTSTLGDARASKPSHHAIGPFDRMVVDAPCSGLGVLRRHPEAKWRKESQAFPRHHRLQRDILDAVAPRLRPGGVLVYSTCSTEPEENEQVVEEFCRVHAEFRRESVAPWLPPLAVGLLTERGDFSTMDNRFSMDGFFAARLRKIES